VHSERQTSVSADHVAQTRFPGRRFGPGYRMREVDDYLGVVEDLLRMRTTDRGAGPDPDPDAEPTDAAGHHPRHRKQHRDHHPTWWIYGIAAVLIVVIIVFTITQT
jgi:DivIVA domain-containing protein